MLFSAKVRKRFLIFIVIPLLITIQFFTEDITLRIIASLLLIVYVGFIIFLRDSGRIEEKFDKEFEAVEEDAPEPQRHEYETDHGEDFKIVSPNKEIEIITADNYRTVTTPSGRKSRFKPPDLKQNFEKIATEELPHELGQDEQFSFVLEKILNVVKEAYIAHTSIFFWYNKAKERLTLEKYISSSKDITQRKFDIENDILSKIVQSEEPELLTEISTNAERDVIRYYEKPQGIKSFVGVPLFYGKKLYGILALDSKDIDAFGIETIYSLGRVVRVISILISLFEEKFAETQADKRLNSLLNILHTDKKFETTEELQNTLEHAVADLIPFDAFTFVYYEPADQDFRTSKIVNKTSLKYAGENLKIELNNSLVGKAIISGMPVKIDDTSTETFIRFAQTEDVSFDGSFLALPLIYDNQNYGVLCFESLKKNIYTNADIQFMKSAIKIFAFIVHTFSSHSILKSLLSLDLETRTYNFDTFIKLVGADLVKSQELSAPGTLALIRIDNFLEEESLFESNPFPKVLKSILQMIKDELSPLSILGRVSERIFGIYFFNSTTKDIFLWAEKLRIKIARKPIVVVSKQTTFTVSVGIASATNKTDINEVLEDAELALNKALEKGGNSVKSLN